MALIKSGWACSKYASYDNSIKVLTLRWIDRHVDVSEHPEKACAKNLRAVTVDTVGFFQVVVETNSERSQLR
ncbi:hypothetical protein BBP40_009000 [Aspergillus hancockii]|nr:hypothetical protein BBP40_009000 [Aspergillus hancockii]